MYTDYMLRCSKSIAKFASRENPHGKLILLYATVSIMEIRGCEVVMTIVRTKPKYIKPNVQCICGAWLACKGIYGSFFFVFHYNQYHRIQ